MHTLNSRLTLTAQLLFQYGVGLGYYSNMASDSGTLVWAVSTPERVSE